jgi:hypothetical protein
MILALTLLSFISCTKDSAKMDATTVNLVDDDVVSNVAFDDITNTVDYATQMLETAIDLGNLKSAEILSDSCPAVTLSSLDLVTWPKTITIDYGTGCTGFYGSTRSGKIIITISDRHDVVNSMRTIAFENYYYNGVKVEGTAEFKNLGPNNNQNIVISAKLIDGKLTLPDSRYIEHSFDHQREWIQGWDTKNIWDDECLITGTATGRTIEGVAYTNTITTGLSWKRVCEFLVSGIIKIEREGIDPVFLDFGNGECDNKATLTKGDLTVDILLKHKLRLIP